LQAVVVVVVKMLLLQVAVVALVDIEQALLWLLLPVLNIRLLLGLAALEVDQAKEVMEQTLFSAQLRPMVAEVAIVEVLQLAD
jgi:hypothetical protein